jgi:hypothetical protein
VILHIARFALAVGELPTPVETVLVALGTSLIGLQLADTVFAAKLKIRVLGKLFGQRQTVGFVLTRRSPSR